MPPYVTFAVVRGDPDVWDFYRSVAWLPAALLAPIAVYSVYVAITRGQHEHPTSG